jgi:hypothetical protein
MNRIKEELEYLAEGMVGPPYNHDEDAELVKEAIDYINKLESALQNVISDILEYERINNLSPAPGKKYCWHSVEVACNLLGEAKSDNEPN